MPRSSSAFLIEDFYAELEPTGQLDTLGKLAHTGRRLLRRTAAGTDYATDANVPRDGDGSRRRRR